MNSQFPYQLVLFLDEQPVVGETVYSGENGWYPQIALKRRFKFEDIDEEMGFRYIDEFCKQLPPKITFKTAQLSTDERMPVKYIPLAEAESLSVYHRRFIEFMGGHIQSKYPDREGDDYLPHVTAEYDGKMVINPNNYIDREFILSKLCVLKDAENDNSVAYRYFKIGE